MKVLDHGFVELRNVACQDPGMDLDRSAANAARMSFDTSGTRMAEEDHKLARYLMRNKHNTPFEMVETWWEVKMPIFVARQFVRHRTASINEVSARYVRLPAEWYIPAPENVNLAPERAKQGRGELADPTLVRDFREDLYITCLRAYEKYLAYLDRGIAPELARTFLHLNHYTHWLWKIDFHNLMNFMSLRDHSHAQWEAQQYGKAKVALIRERMPETMKLYNEFRRMPE
jgi:thymidylate synthase (FAD)